MKKLVIINTLLLSMYVLVSCNEGYTDVQPQFQINSETYFNTPEDYQDALVGAYDATANTYINVLTAEIASDNTLCGGENANDVPGWQEIDDMIHTPVNEQLRSLWQWMYGGINRTNYIFEFQDKLNFPGKNEVLAEASFLRAYYYFELVKFFGDVPMPLDERVTFGQETSFPRVPKEQVYNQIEADLTFAAENLPVEQEQAGRATRGAALALLGKAHLYQDDFQAAATALEQVINLNAYALFDSFSNLFSLQNENSIESVFEVQYSTQQGAGFGCLQCSEGNIMVGFSGVRGYSGPIYASGFSFNVPVQELVDAYEEGDERLRTTVLDIEQFIEEQGGGIEYTQGFEHTGYYNNKYIPRQGEAQSGDVNLTSPRNYRSIRYADVLLMAAEALNRGGIDDGRALQYLNQVRERAGLDPVNAGGAELTEAIYQERRVELAGEGHRFFDLVRTGRAAEEINGFEAGKHELFPIPLIEIELSGNTITQNPNY
jgi:starch-binding outer membrane protein, SusD/RagB family